METNRIDQLITKYNAGQASAAEVNEIEQAIERGIIDLEKLESLDRLENQIVDMSMPSPSANLDAKFYTMLKGEIRTAKPSVWKTFFSWPEAAPRLAFASLTLVIGLVAGFMLHSPSATTNNGQIEMLSQQVTDLREMMMLSLLEKESATERLKAVSLSQEMTQASKKVTAALLETLNKDENVNVRLAALDALRPYAKDGDVRKELVRSISQQESPLVQVALAELMASFQVKSSVSEWQKVLKDDNTPSDVKKKIQQTIDVLI